MAQPPGRCVSVRSCAARHLAPIVAAYAGCRATAALVLCAPESARIIQGPAQLAAGSSARGSRLACRVLPNCTILASAWRASRRLSRLGRLPPPRSGDVRGPWGTRLKLGHPCLRSLGWLGGRRRASRRPRRETSPRVRHPERDIPRRDAACWRPDETRPVPTRPCRLKKTIPITTEEDHKTRRAGAPAARRGGQSAPACRRWIS